jgi:hypothetical protein
MRMGYALVSMCGGSLRGRAAVYSYELLCETRARVWPAHPDGHAADYTGEDHLVRMSG